MMVLVFFATAMLKACDRSSDVFGVPHSASTFHDANLALPLSVDAELLMLSAMWVTLQHPMVHRKLSAALLPVELVKSAWQLLD